MKKVIDGKTYNTETAESIHKTGNGLYPGDFMGYEETLYKTKKGGFFLYGIGNANSRYAARVDNHTYCPGSDIRVISTEQATEWLKTNNT